VPKLMRLGVRPAAAGPVPRGDHFRIPDYLAAPEFVEAARRSFDEIEVATELQHRIADV